jgi:hypothetical protein
MLKLHLPCFEFWYKKNLVINYACFVLKFLGGSDTDSCGEKSPCATVKYALDRLQSKGDDAMPVGVISLQGDEHIIDGFNFTV